VADPTCIVWDVDDTLYLERDYVRSGFRAVGEALEASHGVAGFGEQAWALFQAGVRGDTFNRAAEALGLTDPPIGWMVEVYRTHRPHIRLCPDAVACLETLSHLPMAAVTDGPEASQRAKVEALGVHAFATPVVLTATLGHGMGKPHPASFETVMRAVGGPAQRFVYVADNPAKDFVAPTSLGWRTVRLRRAHGLHTALPSGDDVQVEITSLEALPSILD
jgi:putative hydrolase of the HAD superfamily